MKSKKKYTDNKDPIKKAKSEKNYDGRAGYYPTSVQRLGLPRKEYFSSDEAPKEAQRLKLDQRLVDALFEFSNDMGANSSLTDKKINKYLDTSRKYIGDRIAKKINPDARLRLSEGETEFIPKLDNVIDKISTLSDEDMNSLKSLALSLSGEYNSIDPKASTAEKLKQAAQLAINQDWSSIKPIREKAGLTKDDLISLIQAPEDSSIWEKAAFKAARGAISFKDFRNGGKFDPFEKYRKK